MKHYTRIRDLRESAELTQTQVAERLKMHKTTYTNYEQGKHAVPLQFAETLANFYHVSVDYIADRTAHQQGDSSLTDDEARILRLYDALTERNKGKAELLMEQLLQQQLPK